LRLEELEPRLAPAVNLKITSAFLVDANLDPITAPAVGQRVFILAEWQTTDLTASNQYVVRYWVDGVALDSATITGTPGQNVNWNWYRDGWYASPGSHSVTVLIDAANSVIESNEGDNAITFNFSPTAPDLPVKFLWPMGGEPDQSTIVNYVDVNPGAQPGDYNGGPYTYDGHNAFDVTLANFQSMDAGIPLYAAAPGTVTDVQDGNFDRETGANSNPANYVIINHGNGWETVYWHIARNTVVVKEGQTVQAGQLLGLVGSSGSSTDPHVHFGVYHDGANVEPMYAPAEYFLESPPYQGDLPTTVLDHGITNYEVWNDFKERPSDMGVFPTSANWDVWFWLRISHFKDSDDVRIRWYRPGGTLHTTYTYDPPGIVRYGAYAWILPRSSWSAFPGTWEVAMTVNGTEVARDSFQVTTGTGVSSIRARQGSTYIIDERTTPISFGSAASGGAGSSRVFTVENHGATTLTLSNLVLPPGFSLTGAFPGSVAAGSSATFTVRLDTILVGAKFGAVQFNTNDPEHGVFNFNVEGAVTGTPLFGAPVINLPGPALGYLHGQPPQVLDGTATFSDVNSANLATGSLIVGFASGGRGDDRLGIRHVGSGAGQIGVSGSTVTYGGSVIGVFTGGVGTTPLVVTLTASATPTAVQALLRNITFSNIAASPDTAPRYVRFVVVDNTGLASNYAVKTVVLAPSPNTPPVVTAQDRSAGVLQWIRASELFGVADADGPGITHYQFWDSTPGNQTARFWTNGVGYHPANQTIQITSAQLAGTWVQGASHPGTDLLWVRAFDSFAWSEWKSFNLITKTSDARDGLPYVLDQALNLHFGGSYHQDHGGANEKWILGDDGWYFIKPGGQLFQWDNAPASATGKLIAHLAPFFWEHPGRLHDTTTLQTLPLILDQTLNLHFGGSYHQDYGGANEKWVLGDAGWHFIKPTGELFRWDGAASSATGTLIAALDPLFWEQPALLHDHADAFSLDQTLDLAFTGSYSQNYGGANEKWVLGSDGWYFIKPTGELFRWDGVPNLATGTFIDSLAPLFWQQPAFLHDTVKQTLPVLLNQAFNLRFTGSYSQDYGGANEKWVLGDDGWYFIKPNGDLFRWDGTAGAASGTLVAYLAPVFWEKPELLHESVHQPLPVVLDQSLQLNFTGSYSQNYGGAGERWLVGANNTWYFIKPNGELWRWDGTANSASGTLQALLDPFFWEKPEELWNPRA
jgi:hypothetical protein